MPSETLEMHDIQRGYLKPASPGRSLPLSDQGPSPEHPRKGKQQPDRGRKQTQERWVSISLSGLTVQTLGHQQGAQALSPILLTRSGYEPHPGKLVSLDSTKS